MNLEMGLPEIGADDFARRFSLRSSNLMWLLGAGASASAGIPTACDMIWAFKQSLFVTQRRASPKIVADLSSPTIRAQLQAHIDSSGTLPGAVPLTNMLRYSRQRILRDRSTRLSGLENGWSQTILWPYRVATLMRAQLCRLVWTTNFDPLVADACAKVYDGTGYLTTVALDAPGLASNASMMGDGRLKSSCMVISGPAASRTPR